jgi:hypothetical protein
MRTPVTAGALTALVAGGVMVVLASSTGGLGASLPGIVVLTGVLVVAGYVFGWMVQTGRMRAGFGHGIVYWTVAFPVARLMFEFMVGDDGSRSGLSNGVAGFLVYQALVGGGFGLGFVLLHNQVLALLDWRAKSQHEGQLTDAAEPPGRPG